MILGYTFNQKMLSKAGIQSLRFYVQAANLFTITKYSGVDPELNNGSITEFGVDEGSYPTTKQFIFGLNVKF